MTLLLRYKDSPMHLGGILDKILDRKVHSMYRSVDIYEWGGRHIYLPLLHFKRWVI
jgi:hypothetical protein